MGFQLLSGPLLRRLELDSVSAVVDKTLFVEILSRTSEENRQLVVANQLEVLCVVNQINLLDEVRRLPDLLV